VKLLVRRNTESVAKALDSFDAELCRLGRDKSRCIVRFHTDVDKSFLGKVKKMAVRKGWKQTDAGGYRSQANGIVERRIGVLKQSVRTVLLAATGAAHYYDQLWGHGLMYANYCNNRNDWSEALAPFTQLTGGAYVWDKDDHSFGELCIFHVPEKNRLGPYQQSGELGLWVRKEPASTNSAVIVPIRWCAKQQAWLLQKTITSTTFKVYGGLYPLRKVVPSGAKEAEFDKWLDAAFGPLLQEAAEDEVGEEELTGSDYEVKKVLNSRLIEGKRFYLVEWKGYGRKDATWEPDSALENCPQMKKQYEDSLRVAMAYPGLLHTLDTGPGRIEHDEDSDYEEEESQPALFASAVVSEFAAHAGSSRMEITADDIGEEEARRAVEELMRKQKVKGCANDWAPPYLKEYGAVKSLRLRQLGAEEARAVRSKVLVPRLRMILESKRDGRRK
jgi:hypothetical protein